MFEISKNGSEHQRQNTKDINSALPPPEDQLCGSRKQSAFETLALADIKTIDDHGAVPHPSDMAVEQARKWVEYDEL